MNVLLHIYVYNVIVGILISSISGNDLPTPTKPFTFRNMTRQDYFSLYDAIHTLVRQEEISKEQENTLYDLIGRQDKRLASAYQVRIPPATLSFGTDLGNFTTALQGSRGPNRSAGRAQGPRQRRVREPVAFARAQKRIVNFGAAGAKNLAPGAGILRPDACIEWIFQGITREADSIGFHARPPCS